jgi:large subunit ribosomal protein L35
MPKLKTHKGMKKRFKVSATGKVSHKRCGSSHLNSHKSGKKIRRLRKKAFLTVSAEAHRVRKALKVRESTQPDVVEATRLALLVGAEAEGATPAAEAPAQA